MVPVCQSLGNLGRGGSIPDFSQHAFLAQLAERRSRKAEEIGSTPMEGSSQAVARHPWEMAIPFKVTGW